MNKPPIVIIAGPTAVGKTDISVKLAKMIGGEIISADSMQVYKGMDIGSAKITTEEMQGVKHYLIDCLSPDEDFNVAVFKDMAMEAAKDILSKNKIPILVGGTGFYIQALLKDVDFTEEDNDFEYRNELENIAEENGNEYLHNMLKQIDPVSFDSIPAGNRKRVIRALEFYHIHNYPISVHNENESKKENVFNDVFFCLTMPRDILYDRIEKRVDIMMDKGLVDEVESLRNQSIGKNNTSMQGLGYKEILDYLEGECTLEEAVYTIKRDTRHFAKRQITYFKREKNVCWIDKSEYSDDKKILDYMIEVLKKRGILD